MSAGWRKRGSQAGSAVGVRHHVGGLVGAPGPATTLIKCPKCGTVVQGVLTCKAGIVPQYVGECPEHKSFGVGLDGSSQSPPPWAVRRQELPAPPPAPPPQPPEPAATPLSASCGCLTLNDIVLEPGRSLELSRDAIETLSLQCAGVGGALAAARKLHTEAARRAGDVAHPALSLRASAAATGAGEGLLTLDQAAERVGLSGKTLRNWIYRGKLGGPQGLVYINDSVRIDWEVFAAAFIKRGA